MLFSREKKNGFVPQDELDTPDCYCQSRGGEVVVLNGGDLNREDVHYKDPENAHYPEDIMEIKKQSEYTPENFPNLREEEHCCCKEEKECCCENNNCEESEELQVLFSSMATVLKYLNAIAEKLDIKL